jgi:hypothetical protein
MRPTSKRDDIDHQKMGVTRRHTKDLWRKVISEDNLRRKANASQQGVESLRQYRGFSAKALRSRKCNGCSPCRMSKALPSHQVRAYNKLVDDAICRVLTRKHQPDHFSCIFFYNADSPNHMPNKQGLIRMQLCGLTMI